jgi:hypothetical protein
VNEFPEKHIVRSDRKPCTHDDSSWCTDECKRKQIYIRADIVEAKDREIAELLKIIKFSLFKEDTAGRTVQDTVKKIYTGTYNFEEEAQ